MGIRGVVAQPSDPFEKREGSCMESVVAQGCGDRTACAAVGHRACF
jgi:hypothetical protein